MKMNSNQDQILKYFKFNLLNILDEFEYYYTNNYKNMPLYIRSLYLYFSNLAENSINILKKANYDITMAKNIANIPTIYKKQLSNEEIERFIYDLNLNNDHLIGLCLFPLYFYERFLHYIKYDLEKPLNILYTNIPVIEMNLTKIENYFKTKFIK